MVTRRQRGGRSRLKPAPDGRPQTAGRGDLKRAGQDRELALTRQARLHRERLRDLAQLAASTAHARGNTRRGASSQPTAIGARPLSSAERANAIAAVAKRVEIASAIIARLHDFALTGELRIGAVRLDRIVEQAAALVETDFRSSATPVQVRIAIPELPPVRGSSAALCLLFVTLLYSARDAMPGGGEVTAPAERTRNGVLVTVADEGTGLAPEARGRLFEPFFTTKGAGGAGLGLWLASGTMRRLGGRIRLTNRPRRGALVELTFPFVTAQDGVRKPHGRRRGSRFGQSKARNGAVHGQMV